MPNTWGTCDGRPVTAVTEAVAQVCEIARGKRQISRRDEDKAAAGVRIVSYREDFDYLWGEKWNQNNTYVIVWDGLPERKGDSLVDTGKYLTPLDWAVSASLMIDAEKRADPRARYPELRIVIVDVAPRQSVAGFAAKFFSEFPKRSPFSLPWIRVVRPAPDLFRDEWDLNNLLLNVAAEADGTDPKSTDILIPSMRQCFQRPDPPDLDTIRRLWTANIAQPEDPGDHHALANIVGPLLLLDRQSKDPHSNALRQLLQRLGLVGDAPAIPKEGWVDWGQPAWGEKLDRLCQVSSDPLNVVLADDCAFSQRWAEILCRALRANYNGRKPSAEHPILTGKVALGDIKLNVYAIESAEGWLKSAHILNTDSTAEESEPESIDRRFRLEFDGEDAKPTNVDILFLDLRLHQGAPLEREAAFFRSLLPIARNLQVEERGALISKAGDREFPWPGFAEDELQLVEDWLEKAAAPSATVSRDEKGYIQALTLLPRIVSLADMSLPIVLFSSTGRREIVETLKPYGNIITRFEKPRFFTAGAGIGGEQIPVAFEEAMNAAFDAVVARRVCAALPPSTEPRFTQLATQSSTEDRIWRIEVMLDESGSLPKDKFLTVGALLAVFPPGVDSDAFDNSLSNSFPKIREAGGKKVVRDNVGKIADKLTEEAERQGVFLAAVNLAGNFDDTVYSDFESSDELHDERVGDNLHRELLRCVIELATYLVARGVIPDGERVEFSVRAPSRHIPQDSLPISDKKWRALSKAVFQRWGVSTEEVDSGKTPAIRYFGWDDARPMVEEIMRDYRNSDFEPRAGIARAYSLNDPGRPTGRDVLTMHFFTDALVWALASKNAGNQPSLKKLQAAGLSGRYGRKFATLLTSYRLLTKSLVAEAIARGGPAYFAAVNESAADEFVETLGEELGRAGVSMTGHEFHRLAEILKSELLMNEANGGRRKGEVVKKLDGGLLLREPNGSELWARRKECSGFNQIQVNDDVEFDPDRHTIPGSVVAKRVRRARQS